MKCPKCNAEVFGNFCRTCGYPMATSLQATDSPNRCPSCGTSVRVGAKFCPKCAAPLVRSVSASVQPAEMCPHCGDPLKLGAKFCKSCGKQTSLAPSIPAVAPVQATVPLSPRDQEPLAKTAPPPPSVTSPVPVAPVEPEHGIRPVMAAPQPLPISRPVAQPIRETGTTPISVQESPATKAGLWAHKKMVLSAVAVLAVVGTGLTYWFVLRRPEAHNAPIVQVPLPSQPATTPQSPTPESQTATQPGQPTQTEPQQAANETQNATTTTATSRPARPSRSTPRPIQAQVSQPYEQAHQNAEQALYASRYVEPAEDSALFWARKAKALGDPAADTIEQQVFDKQMGSVQGAIQAHDYSGARAQVTQLAHYFPGRPELQQIPSTIQQEEQKYNQQVEQQRRQAEREAQTKRFQFRHRHVAVFVGNNNSAVSFCTGTLTVMPDGTVRYDCSNSDDPQGRCDHVTFPPGSLKEAKLKSDGSLHLASRQSGNFDFYGAADKVQQALSVITPLVKR